MPRTPVATEDFSSASDPLADPPWVAHTGLESLRAASGTCTISGGALLVVGLETHNATLTANQYAQAVPTVHASAALMLYLRVSPSGTPTGYELWSGFGVDMLIRRMDNASTFVTLATLSGHVLATGQTPSFEATGTDLIAYIDGAEIGRASDATYSSGQAGLGTYTTSGSTQAWDDFVCGDLTTAADSPLLTTLAHHEEGRV